MNKLSNNKQARVMIRKLVRANVMRKDAHSIYAGITDAEFIVIADEILSSILLTK